MLQWQQILRLSYGQFITGLLATLKRWSPALVVFLLLVYLQAREMRSSDGFTWVQTLFAATFFVVLLGIQRSTLPVAQLSPLLPVTRFDLWAGQVIAGFLATFTSLVLATLTWAVFLAIYRWTAIVTEVSVVPTPLTDDGMFTPFSRGWAMIFVATFAFLVRHLIPLSSPLKPHRVMQWVQRSRRVRRAVRGPRRLLVSTAPGIKAQSTLARALPEHGLTFSLLIFFLTPIVAPVLAIKSSFLFFCGAMVALMTLLHHGLRPLALSPRALRSVMASMGGIALVGMGVLYLIAVSDLQHASAERKLAAADFLGVLSRTDEEGILHASLWSGALSAQDVRALGARYRLQKGQFPRIMGADVEAVFRQASPAAMVVWSEWVTPESWTPAVVERFAAKANDVDFDLTTHPIRNAFGTETAHWMGWIKSDSKILQYLALQGLSALSASSIAAAHGVQSVVFQYASALISKSLDDRAAQISPVLWAQTLATVSAVSGVDLKQKMEREGRIEVARALMGETIGRTPAAQTGPEAGGSAHP